MLAALMAMVEALCSRAVVVGGSMPKIPSASRLVLMVKIDL